MICRPEDLMMTTPTLLVLSTDSRRGSKLRLKYRVTRLLISISVSLPHDLWAEVDQTDDGLAVVLPDEGEDLL